MNKNIKSITKYVFMIFLYSLLGRNLIQAKTTILIQKTVDILECFLEKTTVSELFSYFLIIIVGGILWLTFCYINIKICGLFKRLKGLNFLSSLFILILVDIFFFFSLNVHLQLKPLKIFYDSSLADGIYCPVSCMFFVYKYLDIMARHCPESFGKIGYYTSIEFYKKIALKIKSNFRWY